MRLRPLPMAAALVLLLSGCAAPGEQAPGGEAVTVVTDPNQGRMDPTAGPHLHDYWGSQPERKVVDGTVEVPGLQWNGPSIVAAEFRPDAGDVVPQGAASVRVTVSWTDDDPTNRFGGAELWVKTAADAKPQRIGPVAPGAETLLGSTNDRNDLPHQVLSAWSFQLVLLADNTVAGYDLIMYTGTVTLQATAVRGLDIPLYPGHPDQWHNRTEIPLVATGGSARFVGDTESGAWSCFGGTCPFVIVPDDGSLVPYGTDHVTIVLTRSVGVNPTRLEVKAHTAVSRDFEVLGEVERTDTVTTYTVPVLDGFDGPYAKQSQWEFIVSIAQPREGFAVVEDYTLTATAYRGPA